MGFKKLSQPTQLNLLKNELFSEYINTDDQLLLDNFHVVMSVFVVISFEQVK